MQTACSQVDPSLACNLKYSKSLNHGGGISTLFIRGATRINVPPHAGVLYHLPYHLHQRTLTVEYDGKRRICMENPPPAAAYGAYTLDLGSCA